MRLLISILFFTTANLLNAQVLQFEDALKIAIENNNNIKVALKNQVKAENNATLGNAGLLPKLDLLSNYRKSEAQADIEFADGTILDGANSESGGYELTVGGTYSIFKGLAAITTFNKLKNTADLTALQTRLNIESTLLQMSNAYYETAQQQMKLEVTKENLMISKERFEREKYKGELGTSGKLNLLNAQVDLNTDSMSFLELENILKSTKRNLNIILGRDVSTQFSVNPDIDLNKNIQLADITPKVESNNINLLLAQSNLDISELDKKLQMAYLMPSLSASGDYGYSFSESSPGFFASSKSLGYSAALNLSWNLFDGGKKRTALQNASIEIEKNEITKQQAELSVKKDLANAFDLYSYRVRLLSIQTRNLEVASLNFERSKELYNQGQITTTQFREAQLNLMNAKTTIQTTQFIIKLSEIELMRLSGDLIN